MSESISYGKDRELFTTIEHLRNIEISILNYMLESRKNCIDVHDKINEDYFTFSSVRDIFILITDIGFKEMPDDEYLKLKKMFLYSMEFDENKTKYGDLIFPKTTLQSMKYIFTQKASTNIDLDIFELKEYYNSKKDALNSDSNSFYIFEESINSQNEFLYKDNFLITLNTKNIEFIDLNIKMSFSHTLPYFNEYIKNKVGEITSNINDEKAEIKYFKMSRDASTFKKLENLYTWGNEFDIFLEQDRFNLENQLIIEGRNKNIKYIPNDIYLLKGLMFLDLSKNKIRKIPNELSKLKELRSLGLCHNDIKDIPEFIFDMSNLTLLCFHGNKLTNIPKEISKLKNLTKLTISNNDIKDFPVEITKLEKLESLDVENTLIENIPNEFLELENLKEISFDEEHFEFIIKNKFLMKNVNTINLTHSSLTKETEVIKKLNIKYFDDEKWIEDDDLTDKKCIRFSFTEEDD